MLTGLVDAAETSNFVNDGSRYHSLDPARRTKNEASEYRKSSSSKVSFKILNFTCGKLDADKLIELIREFPILYDLTHAKYSDSKAKERVWLWIAERMKQPGNYHSINHFYCLLEAACKKTWSNLRDAYRRALKRRKGASGQAANRKWKYEVEMSFLSRFYKELITVGVTSEDTEDTILERDICEKVDMATPGTPNTSRSEVSSSEHSKVSRKKRKVKETRATVAATVMDYFIENNKEKEADGVEQFCRGIGNALRKFSPYDLAVAKREIFLIISGIEIRQLRGSGTSSFPEHLENGSL
ncbi:uncharacterized protein LOC143210495 [Lasioglossum baleicum]|uniref:uncharacterized protein LOC143210495 n=1 Tax=Lasioglossum baleicum TaxID=434251 RepID=UPI003FCE9FE1